jgi:hypothetical protein
MTDATSRPLWWNQVHARIANLRGMCTDEEPWVEIDKQLYDLDELVWHAAHPGQDGFCEVSEGVLTDLYAANARYEQALELIAVGKRPDGSYNRGREACEQIAREALRKVDDAA